MAERYPEFKLEQFQYAVAREVFADDAARIVYTSKAIDPAAEPLKAPFVRTDGDSGTNKRMRLAEPVF